MSMNCLLEIMLLKSSCLIYVVVVKFYLMVDFFFCILCSEQVQIIQSKTNQTVQSISFYIIHAHFILHLSNIQGYDFGLQNLKQPKLWTIAWSKRLISFMHLSCVFFINLDWLTTCFNFTLTVATICVFLFVVNNFSSILSFSFLLFFQGDGYDDMVSLLRFLHRVNKNLYISSCGVNTNGKSGLFHINL